MQRFDVAVIGCGGIGSAAVQHLAARGLRVVGFDRFPPPHDRGSSHGHTRVIRQAYFEHPLYVPLLRRAYSLWTALEQQRGRQLYHPVGVLEAGPADGIVAPGVLASAEQYELPVQTWSVDEASRRVPGILLDESMQVVFEENAGYLLVEDCIQAYLELARERGAEVRTDEVRRIAARNGSVEVTTEAGTIEAAAAVITAGPWARDLVRHATERMWDLPLEVVRKHLHWRPTRNSSCRVESGFPVFFVEETGEEWGEPVTRFFYGFPQLDSRGVKVAEHSGCSHVADPLLDERLPESEDTRRVSDFVRRRLVNVEPHGGEHACCFYTMTPDGHFIVDQVPQSPHIAFAAGLSGHGFKFASVLGETLAALALGEQPACDLGFLNATRFVES